MTTTADRRAAELMWADAYMQEALAAELHAKAHDIVGNDAAAEVRRGMARAFRHASASKRQDAEQVPHHTEVE